MMKTISSRRAEEIITKYSEWIDTVSNKYSIPAPAIKAILYVELIRIDVLDSVADIAVWSDLFAKKDSSTGYAQIFGSVGLKAVNFAVDRGLTDYEIIGLHTDHRLDAENQEDVRLVWDLLHTSPKANIEIGSINILCAADEMTGRTDFENFSERDYKLTFTRYNQNTREITPYGEEAYAHYLRYRDNKPVNGGENIE